MENLIIEMLIPPEVTAGLKLGEKILNGGMISDTNTAMFVNESALEEILSQKLTPMALGIPQAAAAVTLADWHSPSCAITSRTARQRSLSLQNLRAVPN